MACRTQGCPYTPGPRSEFCRNCRQWLNRWAKLGHVRFRRYLKRHDLAASRVALLTGKKLKRGNRRAA